MHLDVVFEVVEFGECIRVVVERVCVIVQERRVGGSLMRAYLLWSVHDQTTMVAIDCLKFGYCVKQCLALPPNNSETSNEKGERDIYAFEILVLPD